MGGIPLNTAQVKYGWGFNPTKKLKSATIGNMIDWKSQSNIHLGFSSIDSAKIRYG